MDIRHVRYFLAVADAGSITEAARLLHLSQPPLSTAMAKLEAELGVTLFVRRPRGIELTTAGHYLRAAGRRLIAEEQRVSATLRSIGLGLEGDLRVGAEPMGWWRVVSTQVAAFLAEHPKVQLELMDGRPTDLIQNLANGHLDMAIIPVLPEEPLAPVNDVSFTSEVIAHLPLSLIAPASWGLGGNGPAPLAELRDMTWVLPARMPGARSLSRLIDDNLTAAGVSPGRTISVPTVQTAASLVSAGVGLSVISTEMVDHYPGVTPVALVEEWPDLPLGLVRRRDTVATPIAERFADLFR
ncbi:LysR family transcriptional regulator [Nocardia sp. NPDC051750]|uniref:LysR family transcriptional regulator n=1 Tax=Nocardia sp. NPDC051750 TaxID=3364325 RepID=UPI0037A05CE7